MTFEGIHHITLITGDAPRNVDFYTRVLGQRLVKKTVNQDDPTVYHLFYADERGSPGADITFFEYPQARRGRPGAGMIHTIVYRVGSQDALDFWAERLREEGVAVERPAGRVVFDDPEGVRLELARVETDDEPLVAEHPEIPEELALQGFEGVRAYSADPARSRALFEQTLGFVPRGEATWEARGRRRGGVFAFDPAPDYRGFGGAGTVHHVAWASPTEEHDAWLAAVSAAGMQPTPVIDRFYFRSIYFREPSGVLFEIATIGPGFATDEDPEHLGERLSLPPAGTLVLLHGRGADEHDLHPLLDALDPERRLLGLTPRGPLALPPGGAHWYRLAGIPTPDPETFRASFELLAGWLDGLPRPLVLGGFSQGAVMSWALGLGRGAARRPAAIVALSGFMPVVDGLELDLSGLDGFPVAIGHGSLDEVIPARFSREARARLEPAGADLLYRESPLPHTIDPRFLPELRSFVAQAVAAAAPT